MERGEMPIEALLRRLLSRARDPKRPMDCPREEDLSIYLDGALSATEQRELDGHLADCRFCRETLVAAYRAKEERAESVAPSRLTARAMALLPRSRPVKEFLALAVQLTRDSLELLSTSGRMIMPALAAEVRGKGKTTNDRILQVEQDLASYHIGVEIERLDDDLCQLAIHVKSNSGPVAEGLRFSLISAEREQASYLARQGRAIFERISPGDYQLDVSESGNSLGVIRLTIKEWRHER